MKKLLYTGTLLIITMFSSAQSKNSSCEQIKIENKLLKEEIFSLKNTLKISEAIKEVTSDNINYKLVSVEGFSKSQTVAFTFLIKSSLANWEIFNTMLPIIDVDGNQYNFKGCSIGGKVIQGFGNGANIPLFTDVPIKCVFLYEKILPTVKIIKTLNFSRYTTGTNKEIVEFRDLTINWK
jgi:hypothetical protein